jgi:hypothetical protein
MKTSLIKSICTKHLSRAVLLLSVFLYFQFLFVQNLGIRIKGIVTDVAGEPVASIHIIEESVTTLELFLIRTVIYNQYKIS